MKLVQLGAVLLVVLCIPNSKPARAQAPANQVTPPVQEAFFDKQVRPVLEKNCFKCHSHAAGKAKGNLVLDSRAGLLTGGENGPAIVPGKPEESLLIKAIRQTDPDLKMPPGNKKLPEEQIATLVEWVKNGAPWPGQTGREIRQRGKITAEDRQWWAFQPLRVEDPPGIKKDGWPRNEVDRFILARLEAAGITPAPEASRAVLVRRVYFDLWGLPPTPEEAAAFVADPSPTAYESLVDRLLASPRYGERWARHWLDLVRYADSDGYRIDDYRPHAWRYRDYVIASFNDDKPYDRFVQEQLAGDELFPEDPAALIATGYLRHWIYEYNNRDVRGQWATILNDVTDTTGDVFLGLGLQCARCHDHKFDPILQKDYYRFQAFFAPMLPRQDLIAATPPQIREHANRLAAWEQKTAELRRQIADIEEHYRQAAAKAAIKKFPEDIQDMIRKPVAERTPLEHQLAELAYRQVHYEWDRLDNHIKGDAKEKVLALRRQLAAFDKDRPAPLPVPFGVTDVGPKAPPTFIPRHEQVPIEPGFLSVLEEQPARIAPLPSSTGRRAALAQWLTRPDNPLTSRVIVNRVWQQHFGRGLAVHTSDLGRLGEKPSHPELLDWLAARFVRDGWSFKKLHRLILTSATYRQSATHPTPSVGRIKDPGNRFLWRASTRRLDAEQIRDTLFAVTGELNLAASGPGANATEPYRSIFTKVLRNRRDPLLDVFDAPFWFSSASSRDTTTTPVQSLLLLNSPFMLQRARVFAARVRREGSADDGTVVARAYRLAFGRAPTDVETTAALKFLANQQATIDPRRASSAQASFQSGKLPYRDGQAAVISPDGPQQRLEVPPAAGLLSPGDFTIEAFILLRSIYDSGSVRTIAATGHVPTEPGWAFGVTGKRSRRKPQTLVLQFIGKKRDGSVGEDAIFSDQNIQLNKPYYVAAAVKLADKERPGEVAFYVKDLSNDDEPLLTARVAHTITGGFENKHPLTIGGRAVKNASGFDGLIDDVRLSRTALDVGRLLYTAEGVSAETLGYWRFEARPDVFHDSSGHGFNIQAPLAAATPSLTPREAALVDFCHVLLNANEFLYVD